MNKKRWILTSVVVAVVVTVLESVFHGFFLKDLYAATIAIWRPQADMVRLMPFGWLSTLFIAFILVYIYHRGYEGKGSRVAEGLRFGLLMGLFTAVPMAVWCYVTWPVPFILAAAWFAIAMIDMLVGGVLIGLMYKRLPV